MRSDILSSTLLLVVAGTAFTTVDAQPSHGSGHKPAVQSGAGSDSALVANALSAAPPSLAATASVVAHDGRLLRKGSSDWVCMPDMPDVPNNTPMCLDAPWRAVIDAWMNKRTPVVSEVGFGYMLQEDMPVSNTDPFATAPSPTNQWIQRGDPHIMLFLPDPRLLQSLPTDPKSGGPFVMWKGTPYAHVMMPTSPRTK